MLGKQAQYFDVVMLRLRSLQTITVAEGSGLRGTWVESQCAPVFGPIIGRVRLRVNARESFLDMVAQYSKLE